MMRNTSRSTIVVGVALLVSAVTWAVGWWGVVPVAAVVGWYLRGVPTIGGWTALGALLGWALLLAADALGGRFVALGHALAGTVGLPLPALLALTLAIPALLGWSAAALSSAVAALVTTPREDTPTTGA